MQLHKMSACQLAEMMEKKQVSSEELTRACLERIGEVDGNIRAFLTVTEEEALSQARSVDRRRARGEHLSPLAGIPTALKDNICTKGIKTSCASQILYNFVPPYTAAAAEKLNVADAVLIGKCNMDEFGMGSSTENSGYFATSNPFNPVAVPGGSSGGSAAAVAAGEAVFALGSDTGGGVRQPAAFCGVIALKPTYGYVSQYGLISVAPSLEQIGPITRDVTDMALVLNAVCGHDDRDSGSAPEEVPDFRKVLLTDVKGMRIGLPREYFAAGVDSRAAAEIKDAAGKLEDLGAVCEETTLPHTEYALSAYYIIASAEASSNLARYDGVRHGLRVEAEDVLSMFCKTRGQGFGSEVKRRIMTGTWVLSSGNYDAYYRKALQVRALVKSDFDQAFGKYDCLLTPTCPGTAFKAREKTENPVSMYMSDICTIPASLAGLPAMSLPFGKVDGMPVGLQLIGKPFDEKTLLRVGYTLEQCTDKTKPNLSEGGSI